MADDVKSAERNHKGSFVVQVQFQQNATWQGTLTWIDKKRTMRFRSMLEMIKLMDGAISSQEENKLGSWDLSPT